MLKSSFFMPDTYSSYQDAGYWVRFRFWWPNLVTALDSLSLMGYSKGDPDIKKGLNWLIDNQAEDGLWNLSYADDGKKEVSVKANVERLWLSLWIVGFLKDSVNCFVISRASGFNVCLMFVFWVAF